MNILVTGANGQLGCEMRRLGAVSPNNYIFTDVAELDITNAEAVMQAVKQCGVEVIVNCAAYTNVDKAESDEALAELINATAVGNLAAAMKEVSAEDFNQAMGLYQSNPIKAKNNKAEIKENNDEGKTTLSKKDLRDHKNRVKNTLKDMEKVNYLYTSKDDLAKALKETL